jgi:transcriptional regulator with GAF, ATPase, and Fis domain
MTDPSSDAPTEHRESGSAPHSDSAVAQSIERELCHLSATLIGIPAEILDAHIEQAIGHVAEAFKLDRVIVAQRGVEDQMIRASHQWARTGYPPFDIGELDAAVLRAETPWIAARLERGDLVVISRVDDLPPEAGQDRALMRRLGARSATVIPLTVEGQLLGWVAFVNSSHDYSWPPQVVEALRLAGELVASALARKGAALRLQEALDFERLIAELSATFVNVSSDALDQHIVDALERVSKFLNADRGNILHYSAADRVVTRTHQWVREGIPGTPVSESADAFPWLIGRLDEQRASMAAFDLDDLPSDAVTDRASFERLGLRSAILVPMAVEGKVIGMLGFGSVTHAQRWERDLMARLQLVAEVLASALARRQAEVALKTALEENERLRERLAEENVYLQEEVHEARSGEIVGQSEALRATLMRVGQVAGLDVPVLLLGQTGTGKELLARAIHAGSRRSQRPLIAVNCAALPATLIESELFGYERGAFTGALRTKPGRFELADKGTLFLDEIGELEPALQATLLRVLGEGEIQRLGSTTSRKVDVRLITATNRDLARAMREGRFREDLYYRLSVFPIDVPPLRERREDIPLLVWHFIRLRQRALGRSITNVPAAAMDQLTAYSWPGNVRELQNVIERAMILSPGPDLNVTEALGQVSAEREGDAPSADGLKAVERAHIVRVLTACNWKIEGPGQAAERLGLRPSTLRNRMKKLRISRPPR